MRFRSRRSDFIPTLTAEPIKVVAGLPRVSGEGFLCCTRGHRSFGLTRWPELASFEKYTYEGAVWRRDAKAANRVFAACLGGGVMGAAAILARTATRLKEAQFIDVVGSARRVVESDFVVWDAHFTVDDASLLNAYQKLQGDTVKVREFMKAKGELGYTLAPVQVREIVPPLQDLADDQLVSRRLGYQLRQPVQVRSENVAAAARLGLECAELLNQGVVFVTDGTQFIYAKPAEARIQMMREATRDARARAEQIAGESGRKVRELRAARAGVTQINSVDSSATSSEGNNDTTSPTKVIIVTVGAKFALE